MRRVRWTVCGLAICAAVLVWVRERQLESRLREDNRELASRVQELTAQNVELSNHLSQASIPTGTAKDQLSELMRLRNEATRLRQENANLTRLREENRQLRAELGKAGQASSSQTSPVGELASWPKEAWSFAGYASPEAALQSALWAASKGDLQNLIASTTGDFATNITKDLATKTPGEIAAEIMNETAQISAVHLLGKEPVSDQEVRLTLWMEGDHQETNKLSLLRVDNQWKLGKQE